MIQGIWSTLFESTFKKDASLIWKDRREFLFLFFTLAIGESLRGEGKKVCQKKTGVQSGGEQIVETLSS